MKPCARFSPGNLRPALLVGGLAVHLASAPALHAQEPRARNVDGIMDNSFFVEEAYNQEPGVVQHIFTGFYGLNHQPGVDDRAWELAFTQEWPVFSQKHQFAYTVPYSFRESGGRSDNGLGDISLNYRYQAYLDERTWRAFAPSFSLSLPTGDEDKGLGEDTIGLGLNLPFSTALGDRWFLHANAGIDYVPDAASAQERDLVSYNLGGSVIYAATPDLHFLLEWVGDWGHVGELGLPRDREFASILSPGVRKAFNFANDAQLVLGLAAPVGLTGPAPDYGVFVYVSFEHFFAKEGK